MDVTLLATTVATPKPGAILYWTNPTDADFASIDVRRNDGTGWVQIARAAEPAWHQFTELTPGRAYSFGVRARDESGNASAWTPTFVLNGSALTSAVSAAKITYGSSVVVSGKLTRAGTTTGIGGRAVDVQTRLQNVDGTWGAWKRLVTVTTTSTGTYSYAHKTPKNAQYRSVFVGWARDLGSASVARTVSVAPKVTATLPASTITLGRTVSLYGAVSPNRAGKIVYLQRYVSGVWKTLASKSLSSTSAYSFAIKPSSKGKFVYRVRIAAARPYVEGSSPSKTLTVA